MYFDYKDIFLKLNSGFFFVDHEQICNLTCQQEGFKKGFLKRIQNLWLHNTVIPLKEESFFLKSIFSEQACLACQTGSSERHGRASGNLPEKFRRVKPSMKGLKIIPHSH